MDRTIALRKPGEAHKTADMPPRGRGRGKIHWKHKHPHAQENEGKPGKNGIQYRTGDTAYGIHSNRIEAGHIKPMSIRQGRYSEHNSRMGHLPPDRIG